MILKIRATIDLEVCDESINESLGSLETGAFGCDKDGAYRMYYQSRTDLVAFNDVVELGEDERGIDIARLCDMQWIDDGKTGIGFVLISGKKYDLILKENHETS